MANKVSYNWEIRKDMLDPKSRYKLYVDGKITGKTYWKQISGSPDTRYYGVSTDPAILCYVYRVANQIIMKTSDAETVLHTFKES